MVRVHVRKDDALHSAAVNAGLTEKGLVVCMWLCICVCLSCVPLVEHVQQELRRLDGRVDEYALAVDPNDEASGAALGVEAVTRADERNAEHGRLKEGDGGRDLVRQLLVRRRCALLARDVERAAQHVVLEYLQHGVVRVHRDLHLLVARCAKRRY